MKFRFHFVFLTLLLLPYRSLHAQLLEKTVLSLEAAENVAFAAALEAKKRNATVVIVVVDDGGYPLVLKRLYDTQVAPGEVGIGKARTAAIFRRPSRDFEEQIKNGRVASLVLPGATPLQGGVPLVFNGKVVGAIGVSGNTPQEDEDIAKVGAAAFESMITSPTAGASFEEMLPKRKPEATIDLATREGAQLVKGEWRYSDTKIVEIDFKAAGT